MSAPETLLQFGTGRFLRAFADLFVHQAAQAGQAPGRIVAVQSTGPERAARLNAQQGRYHVWIRGRTAAGELVDRVEEVGSIRRALYAGTDWPEVLAVARSPDLHTVLSNTTEAGLRLEDDERPDSAPPRSFPAKLLAVLRARFEAGWPGLTILPCELIEDNAAVLRDLVVTQARRWQSPDALIAWLRSECVWRNTLVDRIVTVPPASPPSLCRDALLTVAEPFAFWAVEDAPGGRALLEHSAIHVVPDVRPYALRKMRILNGAHTALVAHALPRGWTTVREALADPAIRTWLEELLFGEIVPTLEGRVDAPEAFAREALARFQNPFLEHRLADIAQNHALKVQVRLVPTRTEFAARFGRAPRLLDEAIQPG